MSKKLILLLILALVLRLENLNQAPHFGDMEWYFASAHQAIREGRLPLLGITASITWLHQGALWTYFLIPLLGLAVSPVFLSVFFGVGAILLAYFSVGFPVAAVMTILPFDITNSLTAYHTSPLPLFFFASYLLLLRRRSFLSGLFIGFLYQLHLLTFIYWPLWIYLAVRGKLKLLETVFGFALGILPFIISGPVQTFGIFIWLTKQVLTGFEGVSSGLSMAYLTVLYPGLMLTLGWVVKWVVRNRKKCLPQ